MTIDAANLNLVNPTAAKKRKIHLLCKAKIVSLDSKARLKSLRFEVSSDDRRFINTLDQMVAATAAVRQTTGYCDTTWFRK